MRVFGYQTSSMLELDSFVLFVTGASLRSKLFGVTVRSSTVILTIGLSVFILLTLMVVDLLSVSGRLESEQTQRTVGKAVGVARSVIVRL
ncbi:uncharacterized protein TNCV_691961 [Trichonephila clavipes]|nr:uncharacterized protein TNCV_691961 [Trichonephila clavipes]